jgi:hypothetical protein
MDLRQKIKFKKVVYGLLVTLVVLWYGGYIFVKIEEGRSKAIIGWIDDYYVDRGVLPDSLSQLGPKNFRGLTPGYYKVDDDRYVIYYRHSFENVVAWHSWRGKWEKKLYLTPMDSTLLEQVRCAASEFNVGNALAVSVSDSLRISYYGVNSEHFDNSIFRGVICYDNLKIALFDRDSLWKGKLYNENFFEKNNNISWPERKSDTLLIKTYSLPEDKGSLK